MYWTPVRVVRPPAGAGRPRCRLIFPTLYYILYYYTVFQKKRNHLFSTITMVFLRRFLLAMQSAVIATAIPSVRPSVCLSVWHTLVLYPDE